MSSCRSDDIHRHRRLFPTVCATLGLRLLVRDLTRHVLCGWQSFSSLISDLISEPLDSTPNTSILRYPWNAFANPNPTHTLRSRSSNLTGATRPCPLPAASSEWLFIPWQSANTSFFSLDAYFSPPTRHQSQDIRHSK